MWLSMTRPFAFLRPLRTVVGTVGLLAAAASAGTASPADDLQHCQYATSKQTETAIGLCTKLIEDASQTADVRSKAYLARAKHYYYDKWLLSHPEDDAASAASLKLPLSDLAQAIKLVPADPDPRILRAEIYSDLDRLDDAIADLTVVLSADPRNKRALKARAEAFENKDDLDRAIADLTALIEADPMTPDPYEKRSKLWDKKGDAVKSAADLQAFYDRRKAAAELRIDSTNFSLEPIETSKSTYYTTKDNVAVRTEPRADAPVDTLLPRQDAKITATGRTRNDYDAAKRWFALDYADKKPRYVLGGDLLDEDSWKDKRAWTAEARTFPDEIDTAVKSKGAISGAYFAAGDACPTAADVARALPQELTLMAIRLVLIWSDGHSIFTTSPFRHAVLQYTPSQPARVSLQSAGNLTAYRMTPVSPNGASNPDFESIAFTSDASRVFFNFKSTGTGYSYTRGVKCDIDGYRDVTKALVAKILAGIHVR